MPLSCNIYVVTCVYFIVTVLNDHISGAICIAVNTNKFKFDTKNKFFYATNQVIQFENFFIRSHLQKGLKMFVVSRLYGTSVLGMKA